jgi:trehalose 6-phosphate synthase
MILSEFAGAAQSLNGSIVVNPWDSQQVADAIHEAVTMDTATRVENHRKLFKYVNKYTAAFWGGSFIKEMSRIDLDSDRRNNQTITESLVNGDFRSIASTIITSA